MLCSCQDDSILPIVCGTLSVACTEGDSQMIDFLLQQGVMRKLSQLCQSPPDRSAAVGVLCAVIKSENPLHMSVALRPRFGVMDALLLELRGNSNAKAPSYMLESSVRIVTVLSC